MMSPPYVVVLGLLLPQNPSCFEIIDGVCRRSAHSFAAATGVKSEISSSLQIGSLRQPSLSTLAHSSRRAEASPQARELAARPLLRGTVRLLDRRGLSPPSPTNLDRPARRWFETDSAFYGMNQLNGPLLHVSGSARIWED